MEIFKKYFLSSASSSSVWQDLENDTSFSFGLFSLATEVDMSALKFAGFLLLLICILIGWRPVIKEQQ